MPARTSSITVRSVAQTRLRSLRRSHRLRLHRSGKGAKYTRAHPPDCVLASRRYPNRGSALRAEYALKQQPKATKLAWLQAQTNAAADPH